MFRMHNIIYKLVMLVVYILICIFWALPTWGAEPEKPFEMPKISGRGDLWDTSGRLEPLRNMDCGRNCLLAALSLLDMPIPPKSAFFLSDSGWTMAQLEREARKQGLNALAIKVAPEQLKSLNRLTILRTNIVFSGQESVN